MKPYEKYLNAIKSKFEKRGKLLQPPATASELRQMNEAARTHLAYDVPQAYKDFLATVNGLDHNGFSIYATHITLISGRQDRYITGFVERNNQYWEVESNKQFIAFGESGDTRFVFDKQNQKFAEIDQSATDLIADYDSLDALLARLLERSCV